MARPKPHVTIRRALWVELEVLRTDSQRTRRVLVEDDGTIAAFLDWQTFSKTFPIWTVTVGPGIWVGAFSVSDERTVRAWLRSREVPGL